MSTPMLTAQLVGPTGTALPGRAVEAEHLQRRGDAAERALDAPEVVATPDAGDALAGPDGVPDPMSTPMLTAQLVGPTGTALPPDPGPQAYTLLALAA
jgi:hypothetical protein